MAGSAGAVVAVPVVTDQSAGACRLLGLDPQTWQYVRVRKRRDLFRFVPSICGPGGVGTGIDCVGVTVQPLVKRHEGDVPIRSVPPTREVRHCPTMTLDVYAARTTDADQAAGQLIDELLDNP